MLILRKLIFTHSPSFSHIQQNVTLKVSLCPSLEGSRRFIGMQCILKVVKNTTMTNDLACVMVKVFAPQTRCIVDNRRKGIGQRISQLILLIGSWFTTPWTLTTSRNSCLKHITSPTMFAVHSKLRRERLTHAKHTRRRRGLNILPFLGIGLPLFRRWVRGVWIIQYTYDIMSDALGTGSCSIGIITRSTRPFRCCGAIANIHCGFRHGG